MGEGPPLSDPGSQNTIGFATFYLVSLDSKHSFYRNFIFFALSVIRSHSQTVNRSSFHHRLRAICRLSSPFNQRTAPVLSLDIAHHFLFTVCVPWTSFTPFLFLSSRWPSYVARSFVNHNKPFSSNVVFLHRLHRLHIYEYTQIHWTLLSLHVRPVVVLRWSASRLPFLLTVTPPPQNRS